MQSTRRSEDTQEKSGIIRTHSDPTIKSTQTNADIKQSKSEGNLSNKGPINKHIARTQSQILANNQIFINQENMNSYVDEMKKKGT
jgi:hypothetical protein